MDTTRYTKPRPCLPSLQRSRSSRTRVAAPGRARAVSLDEVSDRSLSRDDLVWEARMCLEPMKQRSSIDDLGFDEEDQYDEGEVEGSFENSRKGRDDDGEDIFPQDESVKGVEALVLTEAAVVTPPVTPRSLPQPLSLSGAKYLATRVLGFAGRELGSVVYSLSACCSMQTIQRGDYLYDEGEDSGAFYVVLSGSLKDLGSAVIKSDGEVLGFDDYSLTRPRHAAVVALDRVVAVIFTQRTLDAIGRRDAHVLSTIVRAAASSGHDQL